MTPDGMPPPSDDALRAELAAMGLVLGEVIGLAPVPGSACDSATASVMPMPDGTVVCRCVVCPRCGHHTGNSHQGHYWGMCTVTGEIRVPHFCCGNEFGCELEEGDAWVVPAAHPVTVLHYPAEDGTQTVCALPFDEDELWVPVERREGDAVCWVCEAEGRAAEDVREAPR